MNDISIVDFIIRTISFIGLIVMVISIFRLLKEQVKNESNLVELLDYIKEETYTESEL